MKKIIILILTIFTVTGCTVKYNLKIDNDKIKEVTNFVQDDSIDWNTPLEIYWGYSVQDFMEDDYNTFTGVSINSSEDYYTFQKLEGVEYYNKKRILNRKQNGVQYSYDFNFESYELSKIANYCYSYINFETNEKNIKIKTSKNFKCLDVYEMLEEVEVNITTSWDYKVISSNADKVENGKHTWIITEENASNKPIEIEVKRVFNWRLLLIILVPSVVVITVCYLVIKRKITKNNQL